MVAGLRFNLSVSFHNVSLKFVQLNHPKYTFDALLIITFN